MSLREPHMVGKTLYLCMYVCMYVYMYVCMCTYVVYHDMLTACSSRVSI